MFPWLPNCFLSSQKTEMNSFAGKSKLEITVLEPFQCLLVRECFDLLWSIYRCLDFLPKRRVVNIFGQC